MNITEFLEARIAEDEYDAAPFVNPLGEPAEWYAAEVGGVIEHSRPNQARQRLLTCELNLDARHIARWDPARVLAECAAKRAIVGEHNLVPQTYATGKNWDGPDVGCSICAEWDGLICSEGPCYTLCALAAVYDQHPDYDPAWRV